MLSNRKELEVIKKSKLEVDPTFYSFTRRYQCEVFDQKKLSTQATAKPVFQQFIMAFGGYRMSELTSQMIQQHFTLRARTKAATTVRKEWNLMAGILRYAEEEDLIKNFRKPRLPRNKKKEQNWHTLEEMRLLITHAKGPLKTLLMVLAETGCRIGEALGLQPRHVDIAGLTLKIDQNLYLGTLQTPKTDSSNRTLAISPTLCYSLSQTKEFIFPWTTPSGYAQVSLEMNSLYDRLKLPRKGFHSFRRGNITWLYRGLLIPEVIIGERVGHISQSMTLGVYVQKMDGADKLYIPAIEEGLYGQ